jgi:hypothetical protein
LDFTFSNVKISFEQFKIWNKRDCRNRDLKCIQGEEAHYICPNCDNKVFRGSVKYNHCKERLDLNQFIIVTEEVP